MTLYCFLVRNSQKPYFTTYRKSFEKERKGGHLRDLKRANAYPVSRKRRSWFFYQWFRLRFRSRYQPRPLINKWPTVVAVVITYTTCSNGTVDPGLSSWRKRRGFAPHVCATANPGDLNPATFAGAAAAAAGRIPGDNGIVVFESER